MRIYFERLDKIEAFFPSKVEAMTLEPLKPIKPPKPSIAAKVSFWSQFVGSIGSLFFKGAEDKQKVIDIANGVSQAAIVVDQASQGWQDGENL